ncbi:MAG: SgcJ/EcaC family oxidoreductase [Jatrophihabitantaceae bacterium]
MTASKTTRSSVPTKADQAAIAAVPARMVKAWAEHDADAFADLFVEDGSMMLPGRYAKGKDEIRAFMSAAFAGPYKGTQVTGTPIELRRLATGAVALITVGGVIPAGKKQLADSDAIRASWILVKRDGEWFLSVYHNCPRDPA